MGPLTKLEFNGLVKELKIEDIEFDIVYPEDPNYLVDKIY